MCADQTTCSFYLIEICVLSGGEPKAALLGLKGQKAGQQSFGDLYVIAVEPGGSLSDISQLVGEFLLHDGVELCLIPLQRIKLNMRTCKVIQYFTSKHLWILK